MSDTGSRLMQSSQKASQKDVDRKLVRGAEPDFRVDRDTTFSSRVRKEVLRRAGEGLLHDGTDVTHPVYHTTSLAVKRAMDIVGSFFGLLVLSPVLLVIALLVRLTSRGPVFFIQDRVGLHGAWVKTLKFRTMVVDAESRLQEVINSDPKARAEYDRYHKLQHDPRITSIGRFLRKHSLDELPQLINVLAGSMSLVGPRGYLPTEIMQLADTDRIIQIIQVKPGITGFWQVGGRSNVPFDERLDMDVFYIRHWSLGMDLYLLVNTVWILFFGRGHGAS
ncbi:MAG: sugar transferase [Bacteroidetes bacterium]|nr:sugar transferase [Bacteroidota bacterium]